LAIEEQACKMEGLLSGKGQALAITLQGAGGDGEKTSF
jgi:hypothetical protein